MRRWKLLSLGSLAAMVAIAMIFVVSLNSNRDSLNELRQYVPEAAFRNVNITAFNATRLAAFPKYRWRIHFAAFEFDVLTRNGFRQVDQADRQYILKALSDEFPREFVIEAADLVLSKETERFDIELVLKRSSNEAFIVVLRH